MGASWVGVVQKYSRAKGSDRLLMMILAHESVGAGIVKLDENRLAEKCRISVDELREILGRLEQQGEIIRRGNLLSIRAGIDWE